MESRLDPTIRLTVRRINILRLLAGGKSITAIATATGTTAYTVYEHIEAIRQRLGAHSNPELIRIAILHGFIRADGE